MSTSWRLLELLLVYGLLQSRRVRAWWVYLPIGLAVWGLVHEAGVHATVAGMALALLTRARPDPGEHEAPAERVEHRVGPYSAGLAVPIFALFAAGVPISGGTFEGLVNDPAQSPWSSVWSSACSPVSASRCPF